jgi:hypothetical protein
MNLIFVVAVQGSRFKVQDCMFEIYLRATSNVGCGLQCGDKSRHKRELAFALCVVYVGSVSVALYATVNQRVFWILIVGL